MKTFLILLAGLLLALAAPQRAAAQARADYRIAPNDIIVVDVFGEKDLSREFRVSGTGTINYYFLGEVQVAGRTTSEVREDLTTRLNKDYLVDPQVTVDVKEYRVREVFVNGQVNKPGAISLTGEQELLSLVVANEEAFEGAVRVIPADHEFTDVTDFDLLPVVGTVA